MSPGFVYLDSSVALAELFHEQLRPPEPLWQESLISSRLLDYECWVRLHARGGQRHGDALRSLLARVAKLELIGPVVSTVQEPLSGATRTLDALHLAAMRFLIEEDQRVRLATYDRRLASVARAAGIELYPL